MYRITNIAKISCYLIFVVGCGSHKASLTAKRGEIIQELKDLKQKRTTLVESIQRELKNLEIKWHDDGCPEENLRVIRTYNSIVSKYSTLPASEASMIVSMLDIAVNAVFENIPNIDDEGKNLKRSIDSHNKELSTILQKEVEAKERLARIPLGSNE